jgi:hypothetical protein
MPAAPARRPWSVTSACVLLFLAALALLLVVPALGWDLAHFDRALTEAARRTEADGAEVASARSANTSTDLGFIVVAVLGAAVLVACGWWTRGGRTAARVAACVAAGFTALCCSGVIGLGALLGAGPDTSLLLTEAQRVQARATPGWVDVCENAALVTPVLCLAAVVLLLLPASNRYFRPAPLTYDAGADGIWMAEPPPG